LLQDPPHERGWSRPGHRVPDARRAPWPGRDRHGSSFGRRGRTPGQRGLYDPLRRSRADLCIVLSTAAPLPQGHEPRDRARARRHAAPGHDARRRAPRGLPAQPVAAPARARLFGERFHPAHDPRRDRQLPRPEARDRLAGLLAFPGGRRAPGVEQEHPDPRLPGAAQPGRYRSRRLTTMVLTLWIDAAGVPRTIDQTLLPFELREVALDSPEACAEAIRTMRVRGAPLIGAVGAYGLALALRADPGDAALEAAFAELLETRPTAVNLRWALERVRDHVAGLAPARRAAAAWTVCAAAR